MAHTSFARDRVDYRVNRFVAVVVVAVAAEQSLGGDDDAPLGLGKTLAAFVLVGVAVVGDLLEESVVVVAVSAVVVVHIAGTETLEVADVAAVWAHEMAEQDGCASAGAKNKIVAAGAGEMDFSVPVVPVVASAVPTVLV